MMSSSFDPHISQPHPETPCLSVVHWDRTETLLRSSMILKPLVGLEPNVAVPDGIEGGLESVIKAHRDGVRVGVRLGVGVAVLDAETVSVGDGVLDSVGV
eukprot:TRINITY_DN114_c0_g2_i4.p4 TRINITY_DN114_c0_g2~~TRINITY_DN114_c0_g2_i4.p4  ORF type:complete len:100 (+),score=3.68 TRINITY_DN114_c0_g2_i4:448-747(+)